MQALRLESGLRPNAPDRARQFIERWTALNAQRQAAYQAGDVRGERQIRNSMGEMAKGLERDPQLESILAGKRGGSGSMGLRLRAVSRANLR